MSLSGNPPGRNARGAVAVAVREPGEYFLPMTAFQRLRRGQRIIANAMLMSFCGALLCLAIVPCVGAAPAGHGAPEPSSHPAHDASDHSAHRHGHGDPPAPVDAAACLHCAAALDAACANAALHDRALAQNSFDARKAEAAGTEPRISRTVALPLWQPPPEPRARGSDHRIRPTPDLAPRPLTIRYCVLLI